MPVDISLHPIGNPVSGQLPPAPTVPNLEGQTGLAEGTNSNVLNVTSAYGAVLALVATVKLRVDIRPEADQASLDAATSALVLGANERVHYHLPKGNWILKTVAYV